MKIAIPKHEDRLIRVFALNTNVQATHTALQTQTEAQFVSNLLDHPVGAGGFDLVQLSALEGCGFANYLTEGWDVPAENLMDTRARLDALEGYALLLFTSAFEVRDVTLTIGPDLTLIGTYAEAPVDMRFSALDSEAAQPYTGTPPKTPASTPSKRHAGGSLVVVALFVLAGLIAWWAFS